MATARVLVTGSRTWAAVRVVHTALEEYRAHFGTDLVVVHGACPRGADAIAAAWCRRHGVAQEPHPADWSGPARRRAGMLRNVAMVDSRPVIVLAFIRNASPGATQCARYAERAGVPVRYWRELS